LGFVFSLVGATTAPVVIFVFPGIFWWELGPKEVWWKHKGMCYLLWATGGMIMVLGIGISVCHI
jgi:hypothetical protein